MILIKIASQKAHNILCDPILRISALEEKIRECRFLVRHIAACKALDMY